MGCGSEWAPSGVLVPSEWTGADTAAAAADTASFFALAPCSQVEGAVRWRDTQTCQPALSSHVAS